MLPGLPPLGSPGLYTPALSWPLDFNCLTRFSASNFMSSLLPKCRQPVGHDLMQAGSSPAPTRSEHSVHLYTFLVAALNLGMLKGQPLTQYWQPMQLAWLKSTMPLVYCTIAPSAGQAIRQPGSSQCMHWSLRISHCNPPSVSTSLNLMRFQKFHAVSGMVWYVLSKVVSRNS